jgi:hypothetical protein
MNSTQSHAGVLRPGLASWTTSRKYNPELWHGRGIAPRPSQWRSSVGTTQEGLLSAVTPQRRATKCPVAGPPTTPGRDGDFLGAPRIRSVLCP